LFICLLVARFGAGEGRLAYPRGFGPSDAGFLVFLPPYCGMEYVPRSRSTKEERKWARLQLAIPVFVRARDGNGKDFLEFATAINISAGGALVVVRRSLPKSAPVSLEIPSAPLGPARGIKTPARTLQAKTVWVAHLDDYHLLGLKFARPVSTNGAAVAGNHLRKSSSAV
jgi:hypothetical protein